MSSSIACGRRAALALVLALACITGLAPGAGAQIFVYALNGQGRVTVNAAKVETLKGGGNLKFTDSDQLAEIDWLQMIWTSIAVDGADWWTLRYDGRFSKNGEKEDDYDFTVEFLTPGLIDPTTPSWVATTAFGGNGWALRSDGKVEVSNGSSTDHGAGDFIFRGITNDGASAWILRSDGRVYRDLGSAQFEWNGDAGLEGAQDGDEAWTVWASIAASPADGMLYGLRRDGVVGCADSGIFGGGDGKLPSAGIETTLPFPNDIDDVDAGDLYLAISVLEDGTWIALRGDGKVYSATSDDTPIVDYEGDPGSLDAALYIDIVGTGGSFGALRQDGRVYADTQTSHVLQLPKKSYRELAVSTTTPDLDNVPSQRPTVARYTVTAYTGDSVQIPVLVADVDTPAEDVTVTPVEGTTPDGAAWDAESRTLTWDPVGPAGKSVFKVSVDDGKTKPVTQKYAIRVKDPNDVPEKNIKPKIAKIKKAVILDGAPFSMPVPAFDADGDELVYSVDEEKYPFTDGATFDPETATFTWDTTSLGEVGKTKVQFFVSDGTVQVKRKVTLKVVATLLTFP